MNDEHNSRFLLPARISVLLLGGTFLVLGVVRGEHLEVLEKAVRICLECIGIG